MKTMFKHNGVKGGIKLLNMTTLQGDIISDNPYFKGVSLTCSEADI